MAKQTKTREQLVTTDGMDVLVVSEPDILVAAEGRTVLQEDGRPWPVEGLPDPDTLFTRRRLNDGDLIISTETTEAEAENP